jgi:hypothetical protein
MMPLSIHSIIRVLRSSAIARLGVATLNTIRSVVLRGHAAVDEASSVSVSSQCIISIAYGL